MPNFRATGPDGATAEYTASTPNPAHLAAGWRLEELVDVPPPSDTQADTPADTRVYGGRRRLTKLEFIALFTDAEYVSLIAAAKNSVPLEAWMKKLEYAAPDADGTSIDLDGPATQSGVHALEMLGLLATGRAQEILNG